MWRTKIDDANDALADLVNRHETLRVDFNNLLGKYQLTKSCLMDSLWRYVPEQCENFQYMPKLDKTLIETTTNIATYTLHNALGSGQFSVVRKCTDSNGKIYAIKMVKKDKYRTVESIRRAETELRSLSVLGSHPNILSIHECLHGPLGLYIFTELLPMDLFEFVEKFRCVMDDNTVGFIIGKLLSGVKHIWEMDIVHRDLKPENILIQLTPTDLTLKICDFGLSYVAPEGYMLHDFCGSPGFFAPESVMHSPYCGRKADMFSIGCICLEILTGLKFFRDTWLLPYKGLSKGKVAEFKIAIKSVIDGASRFLKDKYPSEISKSVSSMISYEPIMRPELNFILLRNSWIIKSSTSAAKSSMLSVLHGHTAVNVLLRVPRDTPKTTKTLGAAGKRKIRLPNVSV
jgi:serine/threonine protein kinase